MKYVTTSILLFITINCFAINQELIDGAKLYDAAINALKQIEFDIQSEYRTLESWSQKVDKNKNSYYASEDMDRFYQQRIRETQEKINLLNTQSIEKTETVKKREPIKREYDRQKELELEKDKFKTAVLNFSGMLGLPLLGLIIWLYFFRWIINKNKQLLKEGKITQAEYDRLMSPSDEKSTLFRDDDRTNPATGLRMTDGCDSGGNPYGCSFKSSSMSENYRSRWD